MSEFKYNIDNFVGVFENAFTKEQCDKAILIFENLNDMGFGVTRKEHDKRERTDKDDTAIFPYPEMSMEHLPGEMHKEFLETFWNRCYAPYADKYAILYTASDAHRIYTNKMQKTDVGGGYHVWHYESSSRDSGQRLLAYILYLNDVEEGGETEFLYLHRRIKPKAGTLVIFPAAFTHTHRGNPPLSNTKYIITGWVEF